MKHLQKLVQKDVITCVNISNFPREMADVIDEMAREEGRSRSSQIRVLLHQVLKDRHDRKLTV
jgi:metal-responsive CopG/Arc/MetJ family transcriptional regulator